MQTAAEYYCCACGKCVRRFYDTLPAIHDALTCPECQQELTVGGIFPGMTMPILVVQPRSEPMEIIKRSQFTRYGLNVEELIVQRPNDKGILWCLAPLEEKVVDGRQNYVIQATMHEQEYISREIVRRKFDELYFGPVSIHKIEALHEALGVTSDDNAADSGAMPGQESVTRVSSD